MTKRGLTLISAMHITSSVFINDDESGLHHDYEVWLEELAPHAPIDQYWHSRTCEDSADAHLKRPVIGREVVVAITNGQLTAPTFVHGRPKPRADLPEPCDITMGSA